MRPGRRRDGKKDEQEWQPRNPHQRTPLQVDAETVGHTSSISRTISVPSYKEGDAGVLHHYVARVLVATRHQGFVSRPETLASLQLD